MKKNNLLSIVIVTWNTDRITEKCVDSICRYLTLKNYEIIVVDNGSTDKTAKIFNQKKDIVYLNTGSNLGFAKANNIGLSKAKGDYILFLNSDMEFIDGSINNLFSYFLKSKDIGIIGPKFLNPDLSPQASVFPPQTIKNAFKEYFLDKFTFSKYLPDSSSPSAVWSLSGGAMLMKKTLIDKLGGWDESYFMYFEDLDLCRKVRNLGLKIIYYPKAVVVHHHGLSGKNVASSKNQWRRLIPGSIKYHGFLNHYLINTILWSGQKLKVLKSKFATS